MMASQFTIEINLIQLEFESVHLVIILLFNSLK